MAATVMAGRKIMTRKISSEILKKDHETLIALTAMRGYAPRKANLEVASLTTLEGTLDNAEARMLRARAELEASTDAYYAAALGFHDNIVGARDEVKVQYGDNSDQYASVGRTKRAERKSPRRRTTKVAA
jgi:hypothetical protein